MGKTLAVFLLCFVLAGCGSDPAGDSPGKAAPDAKSPAVSQAEDDTPVNGGRMVEGMLGEPSNLIATLSTDQPSHIVASQIYVAPLKYDKDIQLVPWAAESYEVENGGKLLKFKLREDIRWFDGTPLTARDVEFTYKMMVDPDTPTAYAEDYLAIKEFRRTGNFTFEADYEEPFARALITWAHDILPAHVLEGEDLSNTKYSREPMGAGPYKLKEWVPGSRLVLTANEDYFLGRPYIDELVYRIIPDLATQFLELKAKNLDSMTLTPQQYLFQTKGPFWEDEFAKYKYLAFAYSYMGYNLKDPLFADVRVRRAIAHALDKEEIVKGVLLGLGKPAQGPFKPGTWVYNDKLKDYAYDPALARDLLAQAGWKPGKDGRLMKDGHPFSFTIITNQGNDQRIKAATIIQERLKEIGMEVKIRTVEWAAFIKEFVDTGNFQALILGWNILQDPDIFDVWHSSKAVPGGLNFVGYKNPELDELLEKGRSTLDQDMRKTYYDRIQEIMLEEQPYCFLYVPDSLPILQARIHGVKPAPAGIGYNSIRWWIPKSMQRAHQASVSIYDPHQ